MKSFNYPNHRNIPVKLIFLLVLLAVSTILITKPVRAAEYQFESLYSIPTALPYFQASPPSINNHGTVAYTVPGAVFQNQGLSGEALVIDQDGNLSVYDLGTIGKTSLAKPLINDNGVVAIKANDSGVGSPTGGVYIVSGTPPGVFQAIFTSNRDNVSGDFREIHYFALNNLGEVAAKVILTTGEPAIIKGSISGYQILDVQDIDVRFNFSWPSINDQGAVVYKAQNNSGVFVYMTDGTTPPTKAIDMSGQGNSGDSPDINNLGYVAAATSSSLFIGMDGSISQVVVDGQNSPFPVGEGPLGLDLNNQNKVVFHASDGLYFGDNPVNDKLIQAGDTLFGGVVGASYNHGDAVRFPGIGGLNDAAQVVFRVSVDTQGSMTSHIVKATPLNTPPPDTDDDGVPDDQDICPGGDDNLDSDGDFVPDFCDSCPLDADNDADGDGVCGDVDVCTGGDDAVDFDLDGSPDACDVCPIDPQNDADSDGLCEADDNCEAVWNPDQTDTDEDGYGDACDMDNDNDGVPDSEDNCLYDWNPDQDDFDNDGEGDLCDTDIDGDGVIDALDQCLGTQPGDVVNTDGCSIAELAPCEHAADASKWKNHGGYVRAVAHASQDFVDAGLISEAEKDAIVSASGQSQCGQKN